jgi:surface polysaccharide O-acyltransferase-like enzyme
LTPWAERVGERELRGWIVLWLITTLFPYLRRLWTCLFGEPLFGFGSVPYLYGECPWNQFGTFQYVSGFIGYMLLGLWFRRFAPVLTFGKTLATAVPLWLAGAAIIGGGFFFRIGGSFPYSAPYAKAVDLEMSIEYCSLGVVMATAAVFLALRRISGGGRFYRLIVRPLSEASYGTYLLHMFVLLPVFEFVRPQLPTPLAIVVTAAVSFALSSLISAGIRKIPKIGVWICG